MKRRLAHWGPALYSWRKPPNKKPMTICVAAIGGNGIVFCAADRMKTGGDIEFEPKRVDPPEAALPWLFGSKIFSATASIAALTAGESALQSEILQEVWFNIQSRIAAAPTKWIKIKDAVEMYVDCYDKIKLKRAASAVLAPLALTPETFIQNQNSMASDFISEIKREMQSFDMPRIDTIYAGIDQEGPHIYTITNYTTERNCVIKCNDSIGFAAIGSGARHATSQFMQVGYHRGFLTSETLFLTYLAKKRAEIAPGVGNETNMITIGPQLGLSGYIHKDYMKEIDLIYRRHVQSEKRILANAFDKAEKFEKRILAERSQKTQIEPANHPAPSANKPVKK